METSEPQTNIYKLNIYNVMIKKNYEIPESETLIVRFEGNFCETNEDSANNGYRDNPLDPLDDGRD